MKTDDDYLQIKSVDILPCFPHTGKIDITYRCNNNCRHCWLRIPPDSKYKKAELTLQQIKDIVDEAMMMGCRTWFISGGEPMLREDFLEIFDYITAKSVHYSINTNGTLITPKIAKIMRRIGSKKIVLYGADAQVHDYITRNPGSFEATLRGLAYLKEARVGFAVQIIPMKSNYHQLKEMVNLALSFSKRYRFGGNWLYLSADRDEDKNREIISQRLEPKVAVDLDEPYIPCNECLDKKDTPGYYQGQKENYLLSNCIKTKRGFHIDAYGGMSFCLYIKDPRLRYDLKKGSFKECWEEFLPSLSTKIKASDEYKDNCGSCKLRKECQWCPVYGYLEHGRYTARVEYLCRMAEEKLRYKTRWVKEHRRYYRTGGITVEVNSDLPIGKETFKPKFKMFEVDRPGKDNIILEHHFYLPDLKNKDLGKEIYRRQPWAIYKKNGAWIYTGINREYMNQIIVCNEDHSHSIVYNNERIRDLFLKGGLGALTLMPTDQVILARVLAERQGCYIHACGVDYQGRGLLFVGHSGAGKSTIASLLDGRANILCDDRIILRRCGNRFKIYGTWSHGQFARISAQSVPLQAVLFLEKSPKNKLVRLKDRKEMTKLILGCIIKPMVTVDWWEKIISLVEKMSNVVPCYTIKFNKERSVAGLLSKL